MCMPEGYTSIIKQAEQSCLLQSLCVFDLMLPSSFDKNRFLQWRNMNNMTIILQQKAPLLLHLKRGAVPMVENT